MPYYNRGSPRSTSKMITPASNKVIISGFLNTVTDMVDASCSYLLWGPVQYTVGCLAAPLACTFQLSVVTHPPVSYDQKCLQMLPNVLWVGQNYPSLRTTGLNHPSYPSWESVPSSYQKWQDGLIKTIERGKKHSRLWWIMTQKQLFCLLYLKFCLTAGILFL